MLHRITSLLLLSLPVTGYATTPASTKPGKPNVIFILSDDLGWGDVGCYGAKNIRTPNIDRMAAEGVRFTNGYSPASTCTPTRYSIITGKYAWRKGVGVLPGNAPMAVKTDHLTLPGIFKQMGYSTACVGKWHLGLGNGNTNFNHEIKPGLREAGFDYSYIIPATNDRVPCVYIENDRVAGLDPSDPIEVNFRQKVGNWPTGKENPELLKLKSHEGHNNTIINGIGRIGFMTGGKSALWVDEEMAGTLTGKAVKFINDYSDRPFFLYFATHNIHEPRVPGKDFAGKSSCGVYGDVIEELDWSIGQIMKALKDKGIDRNTWIIFTSDNGARVLEGYRDGATENLNGHTPTGGLRGGKYTLLEGGTRVPFISRWPAQIRPGISDAPVGQIDLMASYAALLGYEINRADSIDSRDALKVLMGKSRKTPHNEVIIQDNGKNIAIRIGDWKFIPKGSYMAEDEDLLYNLKSDPGETTNLINTHPEKSKQLEKRLKELREK